MLGEAVEDRAARCEDLSSSKLVWNSRCLLEPSSSSLLDKLLQGVGREGVGRMLYTYVHVCIDNV